MARFQATRVPKPFSSPEADRPPLWSGNRPLNYIRRAALLAFGSFCSRQRFLSTGWVTLTYRGPVDRFGTGLWMAGAVASGGPASARIAAELGDAILVTKPRTDITDAYVQAGGDGPRYAEVPLSWATDEAEAAWSAREAFRFGLTGWKVQSELPNPINFEAATAFITEEDMRGVFGVGPDASAHLAVAQQFVDAGYDHLALINAGPDPDGFLDFFASELAEPLRKLTPSS